MLAPGSLDESTCYCFKATASLTVTTDKQSQMLYQNGIEEVAIHEGEVIPSNYRLIFYRLLLASTSAPPGLLQAWLCLSAVKRASVADLLDSVDRWVYKKEDFPQAMSFSFSIQHHLLLFRQTVFSHFSHCVFRFLLTLPTNRSLHQPNQ